MIQLELSELNNDRAALSFVNRMLSTSCDWSRKVGEIRDKLNQARIITLSFIHTLTWIRHLQFFKSSIERRKFLQPWMD